MRDRLSDAALTNANEKLCCLPTATEKAERTKLKINGTKQEEDIDSHKKAKRKR